MIENDGYSHMKSEGETIQYIQYNNGHVIYKWSEEDAEFTKRNNESVLAKMLKEKNKSDGYLCDKPL